MALYLLPIFFHLDPQYELAKAIFNIPLRIRKIKTKSKHPEPSSLSLLNDERFCVKYSEKCATWISGLSCQATHSETISLARETFFAVKTCEKYHESRLPIISKTWAQAAFNVEYFSEVADPTYNAKTLPSINNNYEIGHCQKTEAILKYFNLNSRIQRWKWLVIVDDDTLLSVHKILELLKCYDSKKAIAIGERYGFKVAEGKYGYDFLTGGAGMVFSQELVKKMAGNSNCACPDPEEADDMYFGGRCVKKVGASLIHSDRFHQGCPSDYVPELLQHNDPISFHKFWKGESEHIQYSDNGTLKKMRKKSWIFPIQIYETYFKTSDKYLTYHKQNEIILRQEL